MRVQSISSHIPGAKLFWDRVTLSRITAFYFVFSVLHFIVQVVFQIQAFNINAHAASLLSGFISQGNATAPGFMVLGSDLLVWNGNSTLDMSTTLDSDYVAGNSSSSAWNASSLDASIVPLSNLSNSSSSASSMGSGLSSQNATSPSPTPPSSTPVSVTTVVHTVTITVPASSLPTPASSAGGNATNQTQRHSIERRSSTSSTPIQVDGAAGVQVSGIPGLGPFTLDHACLNVLNWPVEQLDNTKREDIAFILFQFWLLGMSLVALMNESIPHIVASLLTHILATAWGGFQIWNTHDFRMDFNSFTSTGACGVDLLPDYWLERSRAEIPSLVFNVVALLGSAILSWRLMKCFGWQTFKRVGASRAINRVYTAVLLLSISIQLTLFFIAITGAIWIDQLYHGAIGHLATSSTLFKVIIIVVLVLLVPWLTVGWISVRREQRFPMLLFLALSIVYAGGWASMFTSPTFRWTFMQWRFFSLIATAAVLLTLISFVLGIICRLNFGKGLTRYLNAQEPIPDETSGKTQDFDAEKAAFPSTDAPLPTFSAAFGSGSEVPPPSQMFANRQLGPRFYATSAAPFDPQPVALPEPVSPSPSTHSTASSQSNKSSEKDVAPSKRWVIE